MKVSRSTFKKQKCYPKVTRAVHEILQESTFVAPTEVLIRTGHLTRKQLEDWRFGRVPYLERVITGNLAKLVRILEVLKHHAEERGLKPSPTDYRTWGKGQKTRLRFSKTANPWVEKLYATHYVAGSRKKKKAEPADDDHAEAGEAEAPDRGGRARVSPTRSLSGSRRATPHRDPRFLDGAGD